MLYRLTNDKKYLHRALMFAEFLSSPEFEQQARVPDSNHDITKIFLKVALNTYKKCPY
jgi:hypothetical protein